jgi:hypothetical protein
MGAAFAAADVTGVVPIVTIALTVVAATAAPLHAPRLGHQRSGADTGSAGHGLARTSCHHEDQCRHGGGHHGCP